MPKGTTYVPEGTKTNPIPCPSRPYSPSSTTNGLILLKAHPQKTHFKPKTMDKI